MGPLLSDLTRKMQEKAAKGDADPTKILIHSTHDTCLAGLSSTLDMFDDKYDPIVRAVDHVTHCALFVAGGRRSPPRSRSSCSGNAIPLLRRRRRGRTSCQYWAVRETQPSTVCLRLPDICVCIVMTAILIFYLPTDVRVRYQNENKVLPLCAEEGKHLPGSPEFCTLAAFAERVRELTPKDWEAECAYVPGNRQKDREEAQAAAEKIISKPSPSKP